MNHQMKELQRCLANDIRGLKIVEMDDFNGFDLIGPDGWTQYTIYCAQQDNHYSAYIAIADIWKGYDKADEKMLRESVPLFSAVSSVKAHHRSISPQLYDDGFIAVNYVTDFQKYMQATYGVSK